LHPDLRRIEQDVRRLEDDIARKRVIVSPDIERIVRALVKYFDSIQQQSV
jgi:hypothetical protein